MNNFVIGAYILCLLKASFAHSVEHGHCLVSQVLHKRWNNTFAFTYPLDIFESKHHSTHDINENNVFKCVAPENFEFNTPHNCTSSYTCPLHPNNFHTALIADRTKCPQQNSTNEEIRIIVLGGSVTVGVNAGGCCCDSDYDTKCPYTEETHCIPIYDSRHFSPSCRWVGHFELFLSSLSPRYKLINLAIRAFNSASMANEIKRLLETNNIKLSSSDIVMIDHSVNDGITSYMPHAVVIGVETLVRRLLLASNGSHPNIILLEMWPFPSTAYLTFYNSTSFEGFDYSKHYRNIADHYNLSVWSYKEVVWSPFAEEHQAKYLQHMRFHMNHVDRRIGGDRQHPPWYIHLLFADLIAHVFLKTIHDKDCQYLNDKEDVTVDSTSTSTSTSSPLPSSLYKLIDPECDDSKPALLFVDFTRPDLSNFTYMYSLGTNSSWRHAEDRPGKFGLVSTYEGDDKSEHCVVFPIIMTNIIHSSTKMLIKVTHLMTYLNAGQIFIQYCDDYIVQIESLWDHFGENKFSIPQTFAHPFTIGDLYKRCGWDHTNLKLYLCHRFVPPHPKHMHIFYARTPQQKFRLDSVEICEMRLKEKDISDSFIH